MPTTVLRSVYDRLAEAVGDVCADLNLSIHGVKVTTTVRRLAVQRVNTDTLPLLLVAFSPRPEESRPFDTGSTQEVWYSVQLVLLDDGNRTMGAGVPATDNDILAARELLRRAFQRPDNVIAKGMTEVLRSEVRPDAPLSRGKWAQNFDATGITVRFQCEETATA